MFRSTILTLFCIGLLGFISSNALAGEKCAQTITAKCEGCHQVDVICSELGKNSKDEWTTTINTMVAYGAELSPEEETSLIECLSSQSADIAALCK